MGRTVTIALPHANSGWNLWRDGRLMRTVEDLREGASGIPGIVVGVPASHCTTFTVALPTKDASLYASMAFAQVDKRGLSNHGDPGSTPFAYHVVDSSAGETVLSVDVLGRDFPERFCLPQAGGYAASGRLLNLPENRLALWKEQGRLIVAANRHGKLTHMQVLTSGAQLDVAAAQEINLCSLSLQGEGLIDESPELEVFGEFTPQQKQAFERALTLPVTFRADLPISRRLDGEVLSESSLPLPVRDYRLRRKRSRRRAEWVTVLIAFYAIAGSSLWLYGKKQQEKISRLEAQVEQTMPVVREVEKTRLRWQELEPAIEVTRYPLVQLNEITRIMPPSGVQIREYQTKGSSIRIQGQARDPQIAFQFAEDLKSSQAFPGYEWNMPQPQVNQNNIASFDIRGELAYEKSN